MNAGAASDARSHSGRCLCGRVRFEVRGELGPIGRCHCSRCRRWHGGGSSVFARVPREAFRWLAGEEHVRTWATPEGTARHFCRHCGSKLFAGREPPGTHLHLRIGALEGDPGARPAYHAYVDSRAAWDEIHDELPRFAERPPKWRD